MSKPRVPIGEQVKRFAARFGITVDEKISAALTELMSDNLRYREKARAAGEAPYKPDAALLEAQSEVERLEREIERLTAFVPATGEVKLSAADATLFEEYKKLGTPVDLKKAVDELPTLKATVADTAGRAIASEAAALLGWNVEATVAAAKDKGLVITLVDAQKDGKTVKVPHVRPASDEKAAPVPFDGWIAANASYLTPALSAKSTTPPVTQQQSFTTPFPTQSGSSTPPVAGDFVAEFQKRTQDARDARPNPLIPRKAAVT